jgi:hypothetical protein
MDKEITFMTLVELKLKPGAIVPTGQLLVILISSHTVQEIILMLIHIQVLLIMKIFQVIVQIQQVQHIN